MNAHDINQVAEISLKYQPLIPPSQLPTIENSRDAYNIFRENWNSDTLQLQEEFKVMLLNRNNKVLGIATTSIGGMTATVVDPKFVFGTALIGAASSIILAHNHTSGNLLPSSQDKALTRKLSTLGDLLEIKVCDHIIVTAESFYSFADNGHLRSKAVSKYTGQPLI